jgi:hypothetical protein
MASSGAIQSTVFTCQTARPSCNQFPSTHQTRMSSFIHSHAELSNDFANLGSRPGVQASLETISFADTLGFSVQLSDVSSPPPPNFHLRGTTCPPTHSQATEQFLPRCTVFTRNLINQWYSLALTLLANSATLACWLMALTLQAISASQWCRSAPLTRQATCALQWCRAPQESDLSNPSSYNSNSGSPFNSASALNRGQKGSIRSSQHLQTAGNRPGSQRPHCTWAWFHSRSMSMHHTP